MAPFEEMQTAMVNRSIRTIKAELEYLCDAAVITPQTLSDLLSRVPEQTALRAPISVGAIPSATPGLIQPPTSPFNNLSLPSQRAPSPAPNGNFNEKQDNSYYQPPPETAQPPPPAYNNAPPPPQANWPALAQAMALYAYTSTDAGDLELQPNDNIAVTEYMNAEWWKGRNTRTNQEGIFPRSYVKVSEDKGAQQVNGSGSQYANNYGNAPLEVSQQGNGEGKTP
ncbi:protein that induces appearance of [PIN+] prion when overproduced, partial [Teratosphaeriaceae sp. CCFEE 6253]